MKFEQLIKMLYDHRHDIAENISEHSRTELLQLLSRVIKKENVSRELFRWYGRENRFSKIRLGSLTPSGKEFTEVTTKELINFASGLAETLKEYIADEDDSIEKRSEQEEDK